MAKETLVLGVPGLWSERSQVMQHCLGRGYLFAGLQSVIMDTRANQPLPFGIEFCGPDPSMRRAFQVAGAGRLSDQLLGQIERHTTMVYLVSEQPPGVKLASQMMDFAELLLDAGGLAVKVETSGVAHPPEYWRELVALELSELAVYHGLTVRVTDPGSGLSYSCGMHQLGLADAVVARVDLEAAGLLDMFNKYLLLQSPRLADGQTFAEDEGFTVYRLFHQSCQLFEPDHLFHNPYGVWRLEAVE